MKFQAKHNQKALKTCCKLSQNNLKYLRIKGQVLNLISSMGRQVRTNKSLLEMNTINKLPTLTLINSY